MPAPADLKGGSSSYLGLPLHGLLAERPARPRRA